MRCETGCDRVGGRGGAGRGRAARGLVWALALATAGSGCDGGGDAPAATIPTVAGSEAPPAVAGAASAGQGAPSGGAAPSGSGTVPQQIAGLGRALAETEGAAEAPLAEDTPLRKVVEDRVEALGGRLLFFAEGGMTPVGERFLELYRQVDAHGFDPAKLDVAGLDAAVKAWTEARDGAARGLAEGGSAAEKTILDIVASTRGQDEAAVSTALERSGLDEAAAEKALEALRTRFASQAGARAAAAKAMAAADKAMIARLVRFAFEMRFARWAHPFRADRGLDEATRRVGAELGAWLAPFFKPEGLDLDGLVAAATPRHPDYPRTVEALARYRDLARRHPNHLELGKEIDKLRRGKSGPPVAKLAERLKQEGYLEAAVDEAFGADLEEAVLTYQKTHQIKDSGEVDKLMRQSLNKTYAERAAQLALSLQRLRESDLHQGEARFGESEMRVRVNLPAFEATVFQKTEEARRHRVVIGNNNTEFDVRTGKRGKMNHTRLFSAEMQTVVLNPTWNVPRRIKEQELDLLLLEEPDYYARHNFAVKVMPDGSEVVVQQPGSGNALGVVKFLFPNDYAIYMHDTPSKNLFSRPVRAFSHGCMRTEDPLALARWLLIEATGRLTAEKFDEVLESRKESAFALDPKIPISTDYVNTGFDVDGRLVFYSDVYGYDRDFAEGKTPYEAEAAHPNTLVFKADP
jgi:murein L,D-transpeptidase YcbB/YkuD